MSGQPTYPRRTQQGASSGTSPGSRHTSSQYPLPQHYQATGMLQPPSQAHLDNHRFVPANSTPTHRQSAADSKWQHPAPNTASPQGSASGSYSRLDTAADAKDAGTRSPSADYGRHGSDDKGMGAGGAGAGADGKGSIWERKAIKVGGHDGGAGAASRDRTPLPEWLREV
ncbi:hypothetical protein F5B21DRAFT_520254 [Xylaria acuta]|nr:hypothetical protein F5B21DRAFT_520254 [Xylaria acuta]